MSGTSLAAMAASELANERCREMMDQYREATNRSQPIAFLQRELTRYLASIAPNQLVCVKSEPIIASRFQIYPIDRSYLLKNNYHARSHTIICDPATPNKERVRLAMPLERAIDFYRMTVGVLRGAAYDHLLFAPHPFAPQEGLIVLAPGEAPPRQWWNAKVAEEPEPNID